MGLEPTTLPREVAPTALDFARIVFAADVTDFEPMEARSGKARPCTATAGGG
jgi:hypothetical protein